ncbi:hypothetical protein ACHAWF_015161 [Thalassiosira exigua]
MADIRKTKALKCSACGKHGGGLKTCAGCQRARYCDATCQIAHRTAHKGECKRRARELLEESVFGSKRDREVLEEVLFDTPPPREECHICFLTLPVDAAGKAYQACCGKVVCSGCLHGVYTGNPSSRPCPFCRTPGATSERENAERTKVRAKAGDAEAIKKLGSLYADGRAGLPKNPTKAVELWLRAGKLGRAGAYQFAGCAYMTGSGVQKNMQKAKHCFKLGAVAGNEQARHNIGTLEHDDGNTMKAIKHYKIAAGSGSDDSLEVLYGLLLNGKITKPEFEEAKQAHQESKGQMKSIHREAASRDKDFVSCGITPKLQRI